MQAGMLLTAVRKALPARRTKRTYFVYVREDNTAGNIFMRRQMCECPQSGDEEIVPN